MGRTAKLNSTRAPGSVLSTAGNADSSPSPKCQASTLHPRSCWGWHDQEEPIWRKEKKLQVNRMPEHTMFKETFILNANKSSVYALFWPSFSHLRVSRPRTEQGKFSWPSKGWQASKQGKCWQPAVTPSNQKHFWPFAQRSIHLPTTEAGWSWQLAHQGWRRQSKVLSLGKPKTAVRRVSRRYIQHIFPNKICQYTHQGSQLWH